MSQAQQTLEFPAVETHNDLAVNYNDRGRSATGFLDKFLHRSGVVGYIAIRKSNLIMRKKLFRRMTGRSARS